MNTFNANIKIYLKYLYFFTLKKVMHLFVWLDRCFNQNENINCINLIFSQRQTILEYFCVINTMNYTNFDSVVICICR